MRRRRFLRSLAVGAGLGVAGQRTAEGAAADPSAFDSSLRRSNALFSIRARMSWSSKRIRVSLASAKGERRTASASARVCSLARTPHASSTCGSLCTGVSFTRRAGRSCTRWELSTWLSGISRARRLEFRSTSCSGGCRGFTWIATRPVFPVPGG